MSSEVFSIALFQHVQVEASLFLSSIDKNETICNMISNGKLVDWFELFIVMQRIV